MAISVQSVSTCGCFGFEMWRGKQSSPPDRRKLMWTINYELCRTVVTRANSTTLALEESMARLARCIVWLRDELTLSNSTRLVMQGTLNCLQKQKKKFKYVFIKNLKSYALPMSLDYGSWNLSLRHYKSPKNNENEWQLFLIIILIKKGFHNFFPKPKIVAKFCMQCKAQAEPSLFYKTCPIYFWRESQTHILAPGNSNGHPHPLPPHLPHYIHSPVTGLG